MLRTYKYRLRPTKKQQYMLSDILFQMQTVYNDAINERRWRWQRNRQSVSYYDQWRRMRDERHRLLDEMGKLNATSIQQMLRRVDKAYQAFYKGKRGLPRFKGRNRFKSVEYRHGDGCKVKGDRLYIQHVGDIHIRLHRPIPEDAAIKSVVIKRSLDKWDMCVQLELPDIEPLPHPGSAVGVDVGLHSLLALSNGSTIDNPRWLRSKLRRLRVAQRRVSRRKRGSKRRRKAAVQVAKIHERIGNQRRDFWHKVTTELVSRYSLIAVENLNLTFMTRNGNLSLSAHDAALGEFFSKLNYKAEEAGSQVVKVNPHNTSQACSGCGVIVEKRLSVRVHSCPDCGVVLDRDVNAALNILARGLRVETLTYRDADCIVSEAPSL